MGILHLVTRLYNKITMKLAITALISLLLAVIVVISAIDEKRFLFDDLQKEIAKVAQCGGLLQQSLCEGCCNSTMWYFDAEKTACTTACGILPWVMTSYSS